MAHPRRHWRDLRVAGPPPRGELSTNQLLEEILAELRRPTLLPVTVCCKTGGAYVFSRWGTEAVNGGGQLDVLATPNLVEVKDLVSAQTPSNRVDDRESIPPPQPIAWEINVYGWEQQDFITGAPINPVPIGDLKDPNASPNSYFLHSSLLKVRVEWESNAGGTYRDVDIAQGSRFVIRASRIHVRLLAPQPFFVDPESGSNAPELGPGLILSSLIGCTISPAESPPGDRVNTFTEMILVPAGQANSFSRIPPGAKRLSIYQHHSGTVGTLYWLMNRQSTILDARIAPIDLGTNRQTEHLEIPGNAQSVLVNPQDINDDRFFTFVYELDI